MKFQTILILVILLSYLAPVFAASSAVGLLASDSFSGHITNASKNGFTSIFVMSDSLAGTMQIDVDDSDIGTIRPLYLVTSLNGNWYMYDHSGNWQSWNRQLKDLTTFTNRNLQSQETLNLPLDSIQEEGQYSLYAGYLNNQNQIVFSKKPLTFTIFDETKSGLRQFSSSEMLEQFLKDGLKTQANLNIDQRVNELDFWGTGAVFTTTSDVTSATTESTTFSTTNIQEIGVEEGDRIKTDGQYLYVLGACNTEQNTTQTNLPERVGINSCIIAHKLKEDTAATEKIGQITLDNKYFFDKLYLASGHTEEQADWLVAMGQNNQFNQIWYDPWSWQSRTTEIQLINTSDASSLVMDQHIQLDGSLVSSRRIDRVLYVVTRFTPWIKNHNIYPVSKEEQASNEEILQKTNLSDLMPSISYDQETFDQLVAAENCFLPPLANDIAPDPSIITITAISLDDPKNTHSTCIVGGSETLYMSPESLYLATTKYQYPRIFIDQQIEPVADEPNFDIDHQTEIHKFSIDGTDIVYKGSGEVTGHLGWHEDKKPFRMSEHNGVLRIATSVGDNWIQQTTSSTSLYTIREQQDGARLEIAGTLEGLGKPGEQLYAARFIGNRGYLVTFRLTDPLYVLDLSNPESPAVLGELEIDGYSDYLHPIGEKYLLGIGKDAIADEQSTDRLGRGAWYQGLKLSLFDVSDPSQPNEVNSIILGKRGTESAVLYDHHALAYLPANDLRHARLAIPIRLHENTPNNEFNDLSQPWARYDHTHTGLYLFDIDTNAKQGIIQHGKIVIEQVSQGYPPRSDRAVLQGENIHYIHGDDVTSSDWRDF